MSYSRYLVPPRSFYKTWLSHVDAYPLFAANAFGVVLVGYFGYRKMFKHNDCDLHTNTVFTPQVDGSMTQQKIDHIDGWWRWMRQFQGKTATINELLLCTSIWISTTRSNVAECVWDRTTITYEPSSELYQMRPTIHPSHLQQMIAMQEVGEDEVQDVLDSFPVRARSSRSYADQVSDAVGTEKGASVIQNLADHAEVLGIQYKILANQGVIKGDSAYAKNYINKLKSYSKDEVPSAAMWKDILEPTEIMSKWSK